VSTVGGTSASDGPASGGHASADHRDQARRGDEAALLKLAVDGDEHAFGELVDAYRGELRAHCYRLLGSVHDAEDAIQDAMLRAWRGLGGFEGRSSFRSWLYSIATRTALDITRHRSRRELPMCISEAASRGVGLDAPLADSIWLEPFPDRWLIAAAAPAPEARYEQRESVELAFVVALQQLPPGQRAALVLRDVMGFSAAETAAQLGLSAAAANSALQRARATVKDRLPARDQQATLRSVGDQRTKAIVARYADALERGDADTLLSLLTADATWSMPPVPTWFSGRVAVRDFLVRYPLRQRWKHYPTTANGQLAVACYLFDAGTATYVPAVIDVLTMEGDLIAAVTGFHVPNRDVPDPATAAQNATAAAQMFTNFAVPTQLPA
jgi:RNA polymerase sigma-70 factor (ECF subfamily)